MTRLGIFGGSFDPLHLGHLSAARHCREAAQLDELWFVPTAHQPHKRGGPVASAQHRGAMIQRALTDQPGLGLSHIELARGGTSYTVDSLREIRRQHPEHALYLILGADTFADLPNWREPAEICKLATLLVVNRPDAIADSQIEVMVPDSLRGVMRVQLVTMPPVEVSSTQIRQRAAAGQAIDTLVPEAVAQYISEHGLYRP